MPERFLRDMLVVDLDVAGDGLFQTQGGVEACGGQHLGDAPVEALDQAVGLRGSGFDQTMLDGMLGTELIEAMQSKG